ncbi:RING zinc finger-containing protein [Cavenderia fasciculata]|uniref:RING-type E3 ubiquitin transferase n=1 Tax=Cavenderia fasciculata TaxID=261658 RepID=F4PUP0_CACFS|nr:RING zinc finger-containing protein [Cavenderia fasciculata]EGG21059.1 RING zinc finger-containing protein [Cavenderia fasciculata]|eukprot:XP_004358909.1 RING zinc finger-containing protein [Cavenderia fasciculata]
MNEEEDICRVCRNGSTPDNQLSYPCKCSGSIKFIHQDCLLEWIKHSKSSSCELCGYPFRFTPIYSDNTPDILPFKELSVEVLKRSFKFLKRFARISFSFMCFLVMIPALTCITFHLFFGMSTKKMLPYTIFNSFLIGVTLYFFIIATSFLSYIFLTFLNGKLIELEIEEPTTTEQEQQVQDDDEEDEEEDDDDDDDTEEDILYDQDHIFDNGLEQQMNQQPAIPAHIPPPPPPAPQQQQQGEVRHIFRIPGVIEILGVQQQDIPLNPEAVLENNNIVVNEHDDGDDIETLIGLRGPISDVILRTASFAIYNFIFLLIFLYLPFQIGKQAILVISQIDTGIGGFKLSQLTEGIINLFIGYSSLALVSLYILSECIKHKIAYKISRLLYSFIKISMIFFIELGIIPFLFGVALDLLTLPLFGGNLESRMNSFTNNKIQYILTRLAFGLFSIIGISSSSRVLHQIFRPEVIWFLKDSADPDFSLVKFLIKAKLHHIFFNISMAFLTYVIIGFLIIFLPLKVLSFVPDLLPMDFGDIFNKLGTDICLIVSTSYFPRFHPQFTFNSFIKTTFTFFVTKLGLDDYMLIRKPTTTNTTNNTTEPVQQPEYNYQPPDQQPEQQQQPEQPQPQQQQQQSQPEYIKPNNYGYKVIIFMVFCWFELFCASLLALSIPVSIGRYLFSLVQFTYHNDTVSLFVGLAVLWLVTKGISTIFSGRTSVDHFFSKIPNVLKLVLMIAIFTVALPLLIGLVFELVVIIPLIANYDESYYIFVIDLFNIWGIGVLLLNFWYQWITSRAPMNNIRNRRPPEDELIPHQNGEQDQQGDGDRWMDRFNQLKRNGFMGIDLWFSLQKIVFPIVYFLLKLLTVPYFISKGVVPFFGGSPILENITFIYGYPVFVFLLASEILYFKLKKSVIHFHNIIRDDRYLIGKHLHNLEQQRQQHH